MRIPKTWIWAAAAIASVLLLYQLFYRFEYYHYGGNVARIDRLTGTVCALPCQAKSPDQVKSTPLQSPTPTLAEANKIIETQAYKKQESAIDDERLQEAIVIAKRAPDLPEHDATYEWHDDREFAKGLTKETLGLMNQEPFPYVGDPETDAQTVFIICLCNAHGSGWRWEVNTKMHRARFINDNAVLKAKYGL